jgi:hypothetical protein
MIPLNLPGCESIRVIGGLYTPSDGLEYLCDDMLHVVVGRYGIHVGWHPEHDASGEYLLTFYKDSWDQILDEQVLEDPYVVAQLVEELASRCQTPVTLRSSSGSTQVHELAITC